MARLALVCTVLALVLAPGVARAQDNPFGPLPPAAPSATPTPTPTTSNGGGDTGRATLLLIGAALLVAFLAMGVFIARDARRTLPVGRRPTDALREELAHRRKREAKARARAKGKAQKAARRRNRAV